MANYLTQWQYESLDIDSQKMWQNIGNGTYQDSQSYMADYTKNLFGEVTAEQTADNREISERIRLTVSVHHAHHEHKH